jgi:hypothetical protein
VVFFRGASFNGAMNVWFADIADNTANKKNEFEFWVIAGEADDCKLVAP